MPATPNAWPTPGCFDDIRVLEIGDEKGEFCGLLMAGQGADVIKIEPPGGNSTRHIGPFYNDVADPSGSLFFWNYNRGKRGVTVDLSTALGRESFMRLVTTAEVIIDAQGLGVMDGLGLGCEDVQKIKPDVIYCSITPFGLTGPWKDFRGSDMVHLALGGSTYLCGYNQIDPGIWDTPPMTPQSWHAFAIGGEHAAMALAAALFYRQTTGLGQLIDVSIHDACAHSTEGTVPRYLYYKHDSFRLQPSQFRCSDGYYIVALVQPPANISQMGKIIAEAGIENKYASPEFANMNFLPTFETRKEIGEIITKWTATKPVIEVFHALQSCRVACGIVRPPEDMISDPQCIENEDFVEIEHPELGKKFVYPRHPRRQKETPWRWGRRAPLIGEHNQELLRIPDKR